MAEGQGRYLARELTAIAKSGLEVSEPYSFKSMGMLAYVGGYRGVSDLPDWKITGSFNCPPLSFHSLFFQGSRRGFCGDPLISLDLAVGG